MRPSHNELIVLLISFISRINPCSRLGLSAWKEINYGGLLGSNRDTHRYTYTEHHRPWFHLVWTSTVVRAWTFFSRPSNLLIDYIRPLVEQSANAPFRVGDKYLARIKYSRCHVLCQSNFCVPFARDPRGFAIFWYFRGWMTLMAGRLGILIRGWCFGVEGERNYLRIICCNYWGS